MTYSSDTTSMGAQQYLHLSDNDLAIAAKEDNNAFEFLTKKFKPNLLGILRKYNMSNEKHQDMYQIGLIALYNAVEKYDPVANGYDPEKSSFMAFAHTCVKRKIITAMNKSNRDQCFSLHDTIQSQNDSGLSYIDTIESTDPDPVDEVFLSEVFVKINQAIVDNLSEFETKVLRRYIQGETYDQIAVSLETSYDVINNTLSKGVRKKLKRAFGIENGNSLDLEAVANYKKAKRSQSEELQEENRSDEVCEGSNGRNKKSRSHSEDASFSTVANNNITNKPTGQEVMTQDSNGKQYTTIGQRIKERRKELGISFDGMEIAGVSRGVLSKIENNTKIPSSEYIANHLGPALKLDAFGIAELMVAGGYWPMEIPRTREALEFLWQHFRSGEISQV